MSPGRCFWGIDLGDDLSTLSWYASTLQLAPPFPKEEVEEEEDADEDEDDTVIGESDDVVLLALLQ